MRDETTAAVYGAAEIEARVAEAAEQARADHALPDDRRDEIACWDDSASDAAIAGATGDADDVLSRWAVSLGSARSRDA